MKFLQQLSKDRYIIETKIYEKYIINSDGKIISKEFELIHPLSQTRLLAMIGKKNYIIDLNGKKITKKSFIVLQILPSKHIVIPIDGMLHKMDYDGNITKMNQ